MTTKLAERKARYEAHIAKINGLRKRMMQSVLDLFAAMLAFEQSRDWEESGSGFATVLADRCGIHRIPAYDAYKDFVARFDPMQASSMGKDAMVEVIRLLQINGGVGKPVASKFVAETSLALSKFRAEHDRFPSDRYAVSLVKDVAKGLKLSVPVSDAVRVRTVSLAVLIGLAKQVAAAGTLADAKAFAATVLAEHAEA